MTFEAGQPVRLKPGSIPYPDLSHGAVYVVGCVIPLPNPDEYYVDPEYWNCEGWKWARKKTRLWVAGHPQVVFLEDLPEISESLLRYHDPEGKGRRSCSGAWFVPV